MVKLSLAPTGALGLGAIYYHFALDEKNHFGTPVSSRNFADEVNLYADWMISEHVFVGGVTGVAFPAKGAEQAIGDEENIFVLEAYMVLTF